MRRLYARGDLSTLLATFGLSILLQRGIAIAFGDRPQFVASPISGGPTILGNTYPTYQALTTLLALAVIAAVVALFLRTDFGLRARATIINPGMAAALGVDTARMNALSFALGSALAGLAGALAAPLVSVVPTMGLDWVVRSFLVVIVAGTGTIWAALGGAAIVGGWETGFTAAYDATYAQITVLIIVWRWCSFGREGSSPASCGEGRGEDESSRRSLPARPLGRAVGDDPARGVSAVRAVRRPLRAFHRLIGAGAVVAGHERRSAMGLCRHPQPGASGLPRTWRLHLCARAAQGGPRFADLAGVRAGDPARGHPGGHRGISGVQGAHPAGLLRADHPGGGAHPATVDGSQLRPDGRLERHHRHPPARFLPAGFQLEGDDDGAVLPARGGRCHRGLPGLARG